MSHSHGNSGGYSETCGGLDSVTPEAWHGPWWFLSQAVAGQEHRMNSQKPGPTEQGWEESWGERSVRWEAPRGPLINSLNFHCNPITACHRSLQSTSLPQWLHVISRKGLGSHVHPGTNRSGQGDGIPGLNISDSRPSLWPGTWGQWLAVQPELQVVGDWAAPTRCCWRKGGEAGQRDWQCPYRWWSQMLTPGTAILCP